MYTLDITTSVVSMKYEIINDSKSSAPMVMINSVSTKAPRMGMTSKASLITILVKTYSMMMSKRVNKIKKRRIFSPKISV